MSVFKTNIIYASREEKAAYVFDKYKSIICDNTLDVGADKMHLKSRVEKNNGQYTGIGLEEYHDHILNLEEAKLPFEDNTFDTVLCLDVLEHLEAIHAVFDELCRVSSRYVIVSPPNAWAEFFEMLKGHDYSENQAQKFYGLPVTPPADRHRWFFGEKEAKYFLEQNAKKMAT